MPRGELHPVDVHSVRRSGESVKENIGPLHTCYDDHFPLYSLAGCHVCHMSYAWETFELGFSGDALN
jgi:hypothetical protein